MKTITKATLFVSLIISLLLVTIFIMLNVAHCQSSVFVYHYQRWLNNLEVIPPPDNYSGTWKTWVGWDIKDETTYKAGVVVQYTKEIKEEGRSGFSLSEFDSISGESEMLLGFKNNQFTYIYCDLGNGHSARLDFNMGYIDSIGLFNGDKSIDVYNQDIDVYWKYRAKLWKVQLLVNKKMQTLQKKFPSYRLDLLRIPESLKEFKKKKRKAPTCHTKNGPPISTKLCSADIPPATICNPPFLW